MNERDYIKPLKSYTRICPNCDEQFTTQDFRKRYCEYMCQVSWNKKRPKLDRENIGKTYKEYVQDARKREPENPFYKK